MPSKLGELADRRGFTPHFIAARRGTLPERLGSECRDGLDRRNRFLRGFLVSQMIKFSACNGKVELIKENPVPLFCISKQLDSLRRSNPGESPVNGDRRNRDTETFLCGRH
jgi:hypothetical protein